MSVDADSSEDDGDNNDDDPPPSRKRAHSTKTPYNMSTEVPMAPAATIGMIPFLYRNEYAVPRPTPAAQNRYCDNRLRRSGTSI